MIKQCERCGTHPATHGMLLCVLCADRKRMADEAAFRASMESAYEAAYERMARIGCASFIPETAEERRTHRQARAKMNFGRGTT